MHPVIKYLKFEISDLNNIKFKISN